MSYKQLTLEQRYEIRAYMQAGFSKNEIAGFIGVHKSTITRELQRNTGLRGYRPRQAHQKAIERLRAAPKHIRFTSDVKDRVESLLKLDFGIAIPSGQPGPDFKPSLFKAWYPYKP